MALEGLSVICSGLGVIEEDDDGNRIGYSRGEYCLDNLKDLLRFLRRDDPETREVFKQICKWNTVGKDIIPIIEHCQDDRNLVLNAVKVLVFVTMPIEPSSNDIPQQIEYLWGLKSSITCSNTIALVVLLLEGPLENLEGDSLTEDDWKLIQLLVTLFRNILAIQDISLQQKVGGSAAEFLFLRDKLLEVMFQENVMDLILVITQHIGGSCGHFRQDNLLLMETIYYIFKGQDPELIAKVHTKASKVAGDAEAAVNSLISIMEEEKEKRKRARCHARISNSQFSGTFTRLAVDGSKTVCKGNPCSASRNTLLKADKGRSGPSKKILWDNGKMPSTKDNLLKLLHEFAKQFLSGGYNVLMQSVREDVEKEHHAIENSDVVTFFQLAEFVMSFHYHCSSTPKPKIEGKMSEASINHDSESTFLKGNACGPVAASMNDSMFLLVIMKWRNAFEGLKQTNDYKFLSASGSLMKIMIRMLDLVLRQSLEDSREPQTARVLLYKLFYDQTEQGMTQFLLSLIKSFDTHKQSRSDFADLVETVHVIIRLMETLQSRGTLRVSKKSRKKRKKNLPTDEDGVTKNSTDQSDQVKKTLSDPISDKNGVEDTTISSQVDEPEALDLDKNGVEDTTIPAQVDEPKPPESESNEAGSNFPETEKSKPDAASNAHGSDVSSDDEQQVITDEVDFKVSTLVSALANNSIIHKLCWLLKFYKSNSFRTNHYIICMLRRVCEDLELSPMLYQLSLIRIFHSILDEQKSTPSKEYENIVSFLKSLTRGMLKKMKSHPLLFVEVLFWKTRKECHYINCESMLQDLGKLKKESRKWEGSSLDDEVGPSEGNRWVRRSIADALGDDEADFVIPNGIDDQNEEDNSPKVQNLKRRNLSPEEEIVDRMSISKKGPDEKTGEKHSLEHGPKRVYKRIKPFLLNDELELKLKDLYQKYKEFPNCTHLITEALDMDEVSPAQISKMLKQLGLNMPSKKRIRTEGSKNSSKKENAFESEVNHHNSLGSSANYSPSQPLRSRKRVGAFSEDQEMMVKALFEQFKDQKRCSSLIASALDSDGKITAAQVSRKLKQLGLRVPNNKLAHANMQLRDEDRDDFHKEDAGGSDDETISLLRKRSKNKQNSEKSKGRPNQDSIKNLSEDESDDDLLSSLRGKRRRSPEKARNDKLPGPSGMQTVTGTDSQDQETRDDILRGGYENPEVNAAEAESLSVFDTEVIAEGLKVSNEHSEDAVPDDKFDKWEHQQLNDEFSDELIDFGDQDHETQVESQKVATVRRKLRMVIDPDEDF